MKKFNIKELGEKLRKHLGEIIVAGAAVVFLITLISVSVPFLSDLFDEEVEPTPGIVTTVDDNVHEHDYSVDNTVNPNCTEQGYSVYLCSCGDTYNADQTDALGHSWGEWIVTKAATEDEEGTETRTCERCGITESQSIDKLTPTIPDKPAHTHSHSIDSTVNPNCTEKGYTVYTCSCGDSYKADYTDALGHKWGAWIVTKQPTESTEGIETRTCERCGITESRSIDKLAPTIPDKPAHSHSYSIDNVVEPTCTEQGYSVYLCSCGDTYNGDQTDALGHEWGEWIVTKQPTEDAEGAETRTCNRCGMEESRSIDKLPHSHSYAVDSVVEPTCTEEGYSIYLCKCGVTYNGDQTDALGHDWSEWTVIKKPTTSKEGTEIRTCERCGLEEERSIAKLPSGGGGHSHSYSVDTILEPTCTEQGYSVYLCRCGKTKNSDYTDALGHLWGEWIVTKAATEDEEGAEARTCERCSTTEDRSIDKLAHTHAYSVESIVEPTCTEQGYSVYLCSCGDTYNADQMEALGHNWSEWTVTKAATEDEEGAETRTCERCGITDSRSIDKLAPSQPPVVNRIGTVRTGTDASSFRLNEQGTYIHTRNGERTGFSGREDGYYLLFGDYVWTDGTEVYYSRAEEQYVLDGQTWEIKTWNGLTAFAGDNVWSDGTDVYYSGNEGNYVLNGDTWEPVTWATDTGDGIFIDCKYLWTDGTNTYYTLHPTVNSVLDKETRTWIKQDWKYNCEGSCKVSGQYIWSDGENIYSSFRNYHYILNGDTWEEMTWNGITEFNGYNVWTDGINFFLFETPYDYVLNGDTWEDAGFDGVGAADGTDVWTDGETIYVGDDIVIK